MSTDLMTRRTARGAMRAEVAESWQRSAAAGVTSDAPEAPVTIDESDLRSLREAHPLARVFPLLDDVLGQAVRDCDAVMAIGDAAGQLLWVCGAPSTLRKAESIGFVEGSNWDERIAGTNAPGLALATGRSATITRAEHFRASVQPWSCAATPIHDPATSELLGVLDVTGGDQVVVPQTLAMVRAAARMAEAELARDQLSTRQAAPRTSGIGLMLESLGRSEALLTVDDGRGRLSTLRLSPRHSELAMLLASAPAGLTGDELAVLLYEDDGGSSTLRAELNRLRGLLGEELLASRPYRLTASVSGDWIATARTLSNALPYLQRYENATVVIKLGGMGMPANGFDWHTRTQPIGSEELAESMAPFMNYCIEQFGPERCMFESNFPVDKVSFSYNIM